MFDPAVEPPISLSDAANLSWLPGRSPGKKLSFCTMWRWATKGVQGHRLAVLRIGGTLYTSEARLKAFIETLSGGPELRRTKAPGAHEAAAIPPARRAGRELDRVGIR